MHGLIVGPTPNPPCRLFIITRLSRNDFPVLYLPATAIIPTLQVIVLRKQLASGVTKYFSKWFRVSLLTLLLVILNHVYWLALLDQILNTEGKVGRIVHEMACGMYLVLIQATVRLGTTLDLLQLCH